MRRLWCVIVMLALLTMWLCFISSPVWMTGRSRLFSRVKVSNFVSTGGGWGAKTWLYYIEQRGRWFNKWGEHAEKSPTISSNSWEQNNKLVSPLWVYRKLHPIECERLQGLPDDYTSWISNTQRYKCLGNAFNVDVVAHILSFIPKKA